MHADAPVNMENAIIVLKPLQYDARGRRADLRIYALALIYLLIYLLIYRGAETS